MAGSQGEDPEVDELEESIPVRRGPPPKASESRQPSAATPRQRAEVVISTQPSASAVPMSAVQAMPPPVARNPKAEALLALAPRSLLFKDEYAYATRNIHDRYVRSLSSRTLIHLLTGLQPRLPCSRCLPCPEDCVPTGSPKAQKCVPCTAGKQPCSWVPGNTARTLEGPGVASVHLLHGQRSAFCELHQVWTRFRLLIPSRC